jgi:hypothetical protein
MGDDLAGGLGVEGDADHAGEVVAAPAGQDAEQGARDLAQRPGHLAEHPVAAQGDDGAPAARRRDGELRGVVEVAGGVDLEVHAEGEQPRLDGGQCLGGPSAAGGGVDDEGDRAGHEAAHLAHPASRMNSSTSSGRSVTT